MDLLLDGCEHCTEVLGQFGSGTARVGQGLLAAGSAAGSAGLAAGQAVGQGVGSAGSAMGSAGSAMASGGQAAFEALSTQSKRFVGALAAEFQDRQKAWKEGFANPATPSTMAPGSPGPAP